MANCKCGGKLVTNDPKKMKYLKCKECEAIVFKESFGVNFTKKEMVDLLQGKEIFKQLKSKKGKDYSAWLEMDFNEKKVKTNFDKEAPDLGECECGGLVKDKGPLYECEQCKRKGMKTISGVAISKAQYKRIFSGEEVQIEGFTSKEGKEFDAGLALKPENDSWVSFVFGQEVKENDLEEEEEKKDDGVSFLGSNADDEEGNDTEDGLFDDINDDDEEDEDINNLGFLTGEHEDE